MIEILTQGPWIDFGPTKPLEDASEVESRLEKLIKTIPREPPVIYPIPFGAFPVSSDSLHALGIT